MKKLLFILPILFSLSAFAQTAIVPSTDSYYVWMQYSAPRVHPSDSVQVAATLLTNGNVSGITWSQPPGQTVTITPTYTSRIGVMAQSSFWLQGLTPGTYSFTASATVNGQLLTYSLQVTVVADPAPRTVTGLSITIDGQLIAIPLSGVKILFSDNSTQSQ
jgi:hypothetical protein